MVLGDLGGEAAVFVLRRTRVVLATCVVLPHWASVALRSLACIAALHRTMQAWSARRGTDLYSTHLLSPFFSGPLEYLSVCLSVWARISFYIDFI